MTAKQLLQIFVFDFILVAGVSYLYPWTVPLWLGLQAAIYDTYVRNQTQAIREGNATLERLLGVMEKREGTLIDQV